ncbi:MAG: HAMP domain-containing histidine kinase [Bacteroidales bacterium]|jgi:signal transduction histidine kinase|nr:HAMP domain-containing histidine kinase [Bacteroidales bacterium]
MKRRIIITLFILVGLSAIPLIMGIFYLYTEAEKVQRSIFVNEVLTAGNEVIDRIDATIKNDSTSLIEMDSDEVVQDDIDMNEVVSMQQSRKFLIDSVTNQPIGVIKTTIYFQENNSRVIANDTEYFTAAFRRLFPLYNEPWNPENAQPGISSTFNIRDINLIQLDSTTTALLNANTLHQFIKEALESENIDSRFDFALYNAFTANFVVEPQSTKPEDILNSEFVFLLKYNEKVSSPHYLIIYFPTVRGIIFQRMSNIIILILVFFIITFNIAFIALYSLYRQKKTADVTNDFINNVTHEFKTPIATISLACEVLSDPTMLEDKDIRASYVEIINDENNRLKDMVTTVLETAQLRKGQIKMNVELVDMHELIQKVTDSFALLINSSNGSLTVALNADRYQVFGDRTHLTNTLTNLIENGIKYSTDSPEILVNTLSDEKHFIISVSDHGIGIPQKSITKIFDNFYRVPHGNIHNVKGYGLGLGYVKKIVQLHHGRIEVQSAEGKGSTFTIYLPLKA